MRRFLAVLERMFLGSAIVLMIGMFVAVCLQVFTRYVMHTPLPWTEEVARYLFVWTSFLGAAVLVRRDDHFSIDLLVRQFSDPYRRAARVGVLLLTLAFSLVMILYGIRVSIRLWGASSPVLQMSLGAVYSVIPIAGAYMLFSSLTSLAVTFSQGREERWSA